MPTGLPDVLDGPSLSMVKRSETAVLTSQVDSTVRVGLVSLKCFDKNIDAMIGHEWLIRKTSLVGLDVAHGGCYEQQSMRAHTHTLRFSMSRSCHRWTAGVDNLSAVHIYARSLDDEY